MADNNPDTTTRELAALAAVPGFDSMPSIDSDSSAALDRALLEATEGEGEGNDQQQNTPPAPKPEPTAEEKAAAEKAKSDEAAKGDVKPEPTAEEKAAEEKAKAEAEANKPKPDELDAVALPPYTKPKTGEAFETVKKIARETITKLRTESEALAAEKKALEEKLQKMADGLTPEQKAEIEELRTFRKKMDVEADPEFKAFDAKVVANTETIYSKLLASGVPQVSIDKIKELGGPAGVDWEPILAKLPPITRRLIETKLVESEEIAEKKTAAIAEAKKNADEFLKTRATETANQRQTLQARAEKQLTAWRGEMAWLKPVTVDAKASPEQKAEAEAFNAVIKEAEEYMKEAIGDDSPEMRATLALAGPELLKTKHEFATFKKSSEAQISKLSEDLKAANALLEKVKKGSTSRLRETSAPDAKLKSGKNIFEESASDALDRYAAEANAE